MKKIIFSGFALILAFTAASALQAQTTQPAKATTPSPELVGQLTKGLSIKPEQAVGGAGALFGLAKSRLNPADFTKVADVVPDMGGLLKAAPKPKQGAAGALGTMGEMLPGKAGGLASMAGSFKSLGLSPGMAIKFVPIMTKFVNVKGGSGVADLLAGALK
jgi:hypothetical protein